MSAARWYVVNVYSGFEKKVAATILEQAEKKGLRQMFEEVLVPSENVIEIHRGNKVNVERNFFPGYVLVKMVLTDDTWHLVRNTQKVTGFLGAKGKPSPISEAEAKKILNRVEELMTKTSTSVHFQVGESVKVVDGPFATFSGLIEEVDEDRMRLKVSVVIFGRATPVELDYTQVERA